MRGYAICTEPRSGSNYLCQILRSTGVLGNPAEYFNGEAQRFRGFEDYPDDPEAQLQQILSMGATANGVYGLKLFTRDFDRVKATTRWAERLPGLCFISLVRLDALGQAISHVRAWQTAAWTWRLEDRRAAEYDFIAINNELVRLVRARARWSYWLAANGATALHIEYERLVQAPQQVVEDIARLIGLDERPRIDPEKVRLQVQRDELNDDWRARFVREARDLGAFH